NGENVVWEPFRARVESGVMATVGAEPHQCRTRPKARLQKAGENHLAIRLQRGRRRGRREVCSKPAREMECAVETPVGVEPRIAEVHLAVGLEDETLGVELGGVETRVHAAVGIEAGQSPTVHTVDRGESPANQYFTIGLRGDTD